MKDERHEGQREDSVSYRMKNVIAAKPSSDIQFDLADLELEKKSKLFRYVETITQIQVQRFFFCCPQNHKMSFSSSEHSWTKIKQTKEICCP